MTCTLSILIASKLKFMIKYMNIFILLSLIPFSVFSQKATISGHIVDQENGEDLIGATIYIQETQTGTSTNMYGFYSISLSPGIYNLRISFVGYEDQNQRIKLDQDKTADFKLIPVSQVLEEIVVSGEAENENITRTEMSSIKMDVQTIKQIPALMGEVDVIKAIQLLPGVQTISEGSSGFSVRGGSMDQNLVLLDEATVYNAGHLMGFFSVFNNDAVKDVKLYKGDIPPRAGGRLSSLLDVRMKDGNLKNIAMTGGIGTISSRLTIEGPLFKDRAAYVISGRRTYADVFLNFSKNETLRNSRLYFYDVNGKLNYKISDKDRIYLSTYAGDDIFKNELFKMGWGNKTFTARWNHLFSKKLFSNLTLIHTSFDYLLGVPEDQPTSFEWDSHMKDWGGKVDYTWYLNNNNTINFGFSSFYHDFEPGSARGLGDSSFIGTYTVPNNHALESGLYISNTQKIGELVTLKYGLRFSHFVNIGETVIYNYDEHYTLFDSTRYNKGEFFSPYYGLEPRLGFTYQLNELSSIKGSYSRTRQYIHLGQNSTAGTPLDVWFPSSPNVKPQIADQFAIGYFRNFDGNRIETSVEAYYKKGQNAIDFKDYAELILNEFYEGELRFGEAWSYGLEFLFRYQYDKINGWIGYTLSTSMKKIPDIQENPFPASYDKPHDVSVVFNYLIDSRFSLGLTWVYSTATPVTFPIGKAEIGNEVVPIYSERNAYRLPWNYHRLDLSLTYKGKEKPNKKWYGEWNLSAYNAYNRKNPWVINFVDDPANPGVTKAEMTYLFGIIPAITYNFKFN